MCKNIFWYCLLNYENYVILLYYILNCHGTLIFPQKFNLFICGNIITIVSHHTREFITYDFQSSTTSAETKLPLLKPHDHWKTEDYHG